MKSTKYPSDAAEPFSYKSGPIPLLLGNELFRLWSTSASIPNWIGSSCVTDPTALCKYSPSYSKIHSMYLKLILLWW